MRRRGGCRQPLDAVVAIRSCAHSGLIELGARAGRLVLVRCQRRMWSCARSEETVRMRLPHTEACATFFCCRMRARLPRGRRLVQGSSTCAGTPACFRTMCSCRPMQPCESRSAAYQSRGELPSAESPPTICPPVQLVSQGVCGLERIAPFVSLASYAAVRSLSLPSRGWLGSAIRFPGAYAFRKFAAPCVACGAYHPCGIGGSLPRKGRGLGSAAGRACDAAEEQKRRERE